MDGEAGTGGLSIGQQDPARDQAMQQETKNEQAVEGGFGADPFATPAEQRGDTAEQSPDETLSGGRKDHPDYHPGQPDQPERDGADGLTGSGPAQP